jgi:hypothetical protein
VFRIVALKEIFSHPKKYGFYVSKEDLYDPIPYKVVTIDTSINDLSAFAQSINSNYKNLKLLNPWIRQNTLPIKDGAKYEVKLPL